MTDASVIAGDGLAVTTGDAKGALDLDHRVVWRRGGAGPKTHLPHQTEYTAWKRLKHWLGATKCLRHSGCLSCLQFSISLNCVRMLRIAGFGRTAPPASGPGSARRTRSRPAAAPGPRKQGSPDKSWSGRGCPSNAQNKRFYGDYRLLSTSRAHLEVFGRLYGISRRQ